jgi:anaerobic magnesium-protoporphyrin IX monomethyl ester cyclase
MRILLVNPSQENFISFQAGWTLGLRDVGYYQPLGILYIAAYLKRDQPDIDIKVVDAASPDMPYGRLQHIIGEFRPDLVGISTYTHTFIDALTISRIAKRINSNTHVTMGGHHLAYFPRETLQHETVDSIIIGEGEFKFANLVRQLRQNQAIEPIQGVFTRNNRDLIACYEKREHFLPDIADLPYPDRSMVADYRYYNALTLDRKMTTIISSRGCPYTCTFCPQGREPYRPRPVGDVVDEIETCFRQGYQHFFFAEDTFNINKKKVIDFCDELSSRRLGISWSCKARIEGVDRATLKCMRDAGCQLVNFGVETGTDEGLRELQKGTITAEIREVFKWCREIGIQTMAYFMIGHPFERREKDIHDNISFLISLDPDYCNINSVNPTPFTPLFDEGVKKGLLDYAPWRQMVLTGQPFVPPNWEEHFTRNQLQRLRNVSLLRFYFRPRYLWTQLRNTTNFSQFFYKAGVAVRMLFGSISGAGE